MSFVRLNFEAYERLPKKQTKPFLKVSWEKKKKQKGLKKRNEHFSCYGCWGFCIRRGRATIKKNHPL